MTLTQSDLDQIRGIVKQEVTIVRDELFELVNQLAIHTQQQIEELRAEMQSEFALLRSEMATGFADTQVQINELNAEMKLIWGELIVIKSKVNNIEASVRQLDRRTHEDDQANFKEIERLSIRVTKLEKRHIVLRDELKALKHPTVK